MFNIIKLGIIFIYFLGYFKKSKYIEKMLGMGSLNEKP